MRTSFREQSNWENERNMKKFLAGLVVVGLGFAGASRTAAAASSKSDLDARLAAATRVINEVMATPWCRA
jgi:hypothetical protein